MDSMSRSARSKPFANLRTISVLLPTVAGAVDAIRFLLLFRMFVAHMSGNSAALGAYLGQGEWSMAFNHLFPIPVFLLAIVAGTFLNEILAGRGVPSPFAWVAAVEGLLLILFMVFSAGSYAEGTLVADSAGVFYCLAALLVAAMGLQNATVQRIGAVPVQATYVTGTLTTLARDAVGYVQWLREEKRRQPGARVLSIVGQSAGQPSYDGVMLGTTRWCAYVVGAALGGLAKQAWGPGALVLPLVILVVVAVADIARTSELDTPRISG